jgi:hypothetical protein
MRTLRLALVAIAFAIALPLAGCGTRPAAEGSEEREAGQAKTDAAHSCDGCEDPGVKRKPGAPRPVRGSG